MKFFYGISKVVLCRVHRKNSFLCQPLSGLINMIEPSLRLCYISFGYQNFDDVVLYVTCTFCAYVLLNVSKSSLALWVRHSLFVFDATIYGSSRVVGI